MYKVVVFVAISFLLLGCGGESSSLAKLPEDIEYHILKDDKKRDIKRSIEIKLNKKVTSAALETIALTLKQSDDRTYQRTFIGYFLEGEDKDQGYWATTHFNPDLDVRIIGLSLEDEKVLTINTEHDPKRTIVGSWLDSRPGVGAKMTLFYADNKLFLESSYSDGSSGVKEMKESEHQGGKKVEDKAGSDFGEYFLINKRGSLEFWSENGNYFTAKKLG